MFDEVRRRAVIAELDELVERCHPSSTPESAALLEQIGVVARVENRAAAAQLVAVGELFAYRLSRCAESEEWAVDTEAAVAAEVGAQLRIGQGLAASRVRYARAMRERLPKVGAVFAAGDIDYRMFQTIVFRTDLITDLDVLRSVDAVLAATVGRWPSLSQGRLAAQVDKIVAKADVDAVRRRQERVAGRQVWMADMGDGLAHLEGTLYAPDAHALDRRLDALAATVCAHDPRTREQRRADALGALAADADWLGCRCGRSDCAAGGRAAGPVVIHVIAPQTSAGWAPGVQIGAEGLIPPEVLAELAASARLVPLAHPADAPPEAGYVPSRALADFVRCRDLTCRWPGCDRPATACDVDHTIPYAAGGPTHAS
ncbi:HNH endonuclease signature motif containing protein, partial [Mycobacterium intracellulare]